jgi:hypothetical protein
MVSSLRIVDWILALALFVLTLITVVRRFE